MENKVENAEKLIIGVRQQRQTSCDSERYHSAEGDIVDCAKQIAARRAAEDKILAAAIEVRIYGAPKNAYLAAAAEAFRLFIIEEADRNNCGYPSDTLWRLVERISRAKEPYAESREELHKWFECLFEPRYREELDKIEIVRK